MGRKKWVNMVSYLIACVSFVLTVLYVWLEWESMLLAAVLASGLLLGLGVPLLLMIWEKESRNDR